MRPKGQDGEDEPLLLSRPSSEDGSIKSRDSSERTAVEDVEAPIDPSVAQDRSVESDVLPETAVLGRNLGWSSAYILIISRVIGSGIFATPGAITRGVGSVGLSLLLW